MAGSEDLNRIRFVVLTILFFTIVAGAFFATYTYGTTQATGGNPPAKPAAAASSSVPTDLAVLLFVCVGGVFLALRITHRRRVTHKASE